jgi:hypothetical protein
MQKAYESLIWHGSSPIVVRNILVVPLTEAEDLARLAPSANAQIAVKSLFTIKGDANKSEYYSVLFNTGEKDIKGVPIINGFAFESKIDGPLKTDLHTLDDASNRAHEYERLKLLHIDRRLLTEIDKINNNNNQNNNPIKRLMDIIQAELKDKVRLYVNDINTRNSINAMLQLGRCYQYGEGVIKDEKQTVTLYAKSALMGNKDAFDTLKWLVLKQKNKTALYPFLNALLLMTEQGNKNALDTLRDKTIRGLIVSTLSQIVKEGDKEAKGVLDEFAKMIKAQASTSAITSVGRSSQFFASRASAIESNKKVAEEKAEQKKPLLQ